MQATTGIKQKNLVPNKLVRQHEDYLVDKNLANRVRTVKPTIKNSNDFFEKKLQSKKKKEVNIHIKFYLSSNL